MLEPLEPLWQKQLGAALGCVLLLGAASGALEGLRRANTTVQALLWLVLAVVWLASGVTLGVRALWLLFF